MINILFLGNCQLNAIKETICLLPSKYNIFNISVHVTNIEKIEIFNIIQKCDIIITQSIKEDYRNMDYLSTNYVINNSNKKCKIIIVDSCFFNFYYFDSIYKSFNNEKLQKPVGYHYDKMIETYNDNKPVNYYIDNYVNNLELKTKDELETIAENSLNELKKRYNSSLTQYNKENIYIISNYEYIKNNYKKKLLFYSMNHPTKYVIQYMCEEINKHLNLPNAINYDIDVLSGVKCILYKCIQKNVNFDIKNHEPFLLNKKNINEIVKIYYDVYKSIGFK
jgi:hypothetical protein